MTKGILHILLFFSLLCLASFNSYAQDLPLQTWFEKTQNGNSYDISIHFLGGDEEISLMTYEIKVEEDGQEIKAARTTGEFLAVSQLPTLLASVNFTLRPGATGKVKLNLFLENKTIWKDQYLIEAVNRTTALADKAPADIKVQSESMPPVATAKPPAVQASAQPTQKTKIDKVNSPYLEDAEIGGLIIDESRTKLGRDFYEQFFNKWIAPNGVGDSFIIKIKELPSFGRISRVSVEVDNQVLMTRSLSPNFGQLEANVNASIRGVRRYLTQRLQMSKDIENEDQIGTGIF